MPPKKAVRAPQENISLGPSARDGNSPRQLHGFNSLLTSLPGELVFGVARIFASFNDTFVHITDLRFVDT